MKTVIEVVQERLKGVETVHQEEIMRGVFKSFDEYKFACGILRGIALALDIVKDIAKTQEEPEDE